VVGKAAEEAMAVKATEGVIVVAGPYGSGGGGPNVV
jgi:hypothetical protein